jgi:hypothetical protein
MLAAQQHIDIVVTDPSAIPDADDASDLGHAFRSQQHLAFIEVKWFQKGSKRWESTTGRRRSLPASSRT